MPSAAQYTEAAVRLGFLDRSRASACLFECGGSADVGALLVERGWLTAAQAEAVLVELRRPLVPAPSRPGAGADTRTWVQGVQVTGPDALLSPAGGKYEVVQLLGRGGMGEVSLASDRFLRRHVAVKSMLPPVDEAARLAFVQEARLTARLEHPNIVPVHEVGSAPDGSPFMVMKRIKGRSLQDILRNLTEGSPSGIDLGDLDTASTSGSTVRLRRPRATRRILPVDRRGAESEDPVLVLNRLLEIFKKVCDAVAFAHSRDVIHRDIKPSNVMVGEFGEVQLMDWGIAKFPGRIETEADARRGLEDAGDALRTAAGVIKGTPAYMAPEQARGDREAHDRRADVYSLGGVLYSILTLLPPIEGSTAAEVLERASSGRLVPPSRRTPDRLVPRELEAIVMKAMDPDPERRYPTALALGSDIDAFLQGKMIGAARYSIWQALGKWAGRNRKALAGRIAGAAVGILSIAFGVYAIASSIHGSEVEELELAVENQRRTQEAETRAREADERKARDERLRAAEDHYAAADAGFHDAAVRVPLAPGAPQPWFEARLPALLELAQACLEHPDAPASWRERLAREADEIQATAESIGDWSLAEHLALAALDWGAIDEATARARLERARALRLEVEAAEPRRIDAALRRLGEAEGR